MRRLPRSFLLLVMVSCGNSHDLPPAPGTSIHSQLSRDMAPDVDPATLAQLVSDDAAFALESYGALDAGQPKIVYAPFGVSSVMAMLYAASAGDTATQIATELHFTLPEDQLDPARDALDLALQSRNADGITLTVLNQLWSFSDELAFAPEFLNTLAVSYGADVRELLGAPEDNRTQINQWASDATNGKITELFPPGSLDDAVFAATNAIYFKGLWKTQFDTSATAPAAFTLLDGSQVDVDTMHASVSAKVYRDDIVTALDLPYKGEALSLLLVEPSDFSSFSRGVPGFVDAGFELFQSAFILVDESGTEAAAATGGAIKANAVIDNRVTIDHPFYAVLRDRGTGEALFFAGVRDPR